MHFPKLKTFGQTLLAVVIGSTVLALFLWAIHSATMFLLKGGL